MWLKSHSWDCSWYWGMGYVNGFTNNMFPERSKDITYHTHWDHLFKHYNDFLRMEGPLSESERWEMLDLMRSAYTLKAMAELAHRGHSNMSKSKDLEDALKDEEQAKYINEVLLPAVLSKVLEMLTPCSSPVHN